MRMGQRAGIGPNVYQQAMPQEPCKSPKAF